VTGFGDADGDAHGNGFGGMMRERGGMHDPYT
jgi:hypothetical protein